MNKEDLIKFEDEIANLFLEKKIRSPVHLAGEGYENTLISIFKCIKFFFCDGFYSFAKVI